MTGAFVCCDPGGCERELHADSAGHMPLFLAGPRTFGQILPSIKKIKSSASVFWETPSFPVANRAAYGNVITPQLVPAGVDAFKRYAPVENKVGLAILVGLAIAPAMHHRRAHRQVRHRAVGRTSRGDSRQCV